MATVGDTVPSFKERRCPGSRKGRSERGYVLRLGTFRAQDRLGFHIKRGAAHETWAGWATAWAFSASASSADETGLADHPTGVRQHVSE